MCNCPHSNHRLLQLVQKGKQPREEVLLLLQMPPPASLSLPFPPIRTSDPLGTAAAALQQPPAISQLYFQAERPCSLLLFPSLALTLPQHPTARALLSHPHTGQLWLSLIPGDAFPHPSALGPVSALPSSLGRPRPRLRTRPCFLPSPSSSFCTCWLLARPA